MTATASDFVLVYSKRSANKCFNRIHTFHYLPHMTKTHIADCPVYDTQLTDLISKVPPSKRL
jgi:hypothetical protein